MIDFIQYYKMLEQKLKEEDYSQDQDVIEKKERKKPKKKQNQIFILPKTKYK